MLCGAKFGPVFHQKNAKWVGPKMSQGLKPYLFKITDGFVFCTSLTDLGVPSTEWQTNTTRRDARGKPHKFASSARVLPWLAGLCDRKMVISVDWLYFQPENDIPSFSSDSVSLSQDHHNARNLCVWRRPLRDLSDPDFPQPTLGMHAHDPMV